MTTAVEAAARPRRRTALWASVAVGLVVVLFIGVLATRDAAVDRVAPSPMVGRPAEEISGPVVVGPGERFALSAKQGTYVVVNFFATWCTPCVREHPELVRFFDRHEAIGDATVVSVVYDDERDAVRSFFAERGGDWPVVEDDGAKVDWGVRGVPESFLVAPDGIVLTRIVGGVTMAGLERLLTEAKRARSQ